MKSKSLRYFNKAANFKQQQNCEYKKQSILIIQSTAAIRRRTDSLHYVVQISKNLIFTEKENLYSVFK